MARRRLNPRRAKIHRNYSFEDVARLNGVHKQTVRNWQKEGLPVMTGKRPYLVMGNALRTFLDKRRRSSKQRCKDGELYCMRCRAPRSPAGDMLDYVPITLISGNLQGICPACEALMYRRVSLSKIDAVKGKCSVAFRQSQQRLTDTPQPCLDCHLASETNDHDKAQRK